MFLKKDQLGWISVVLFSLTPLPLWFLALPLAARYAATATIFTSIGEITGLVGICMYAATQILGARLKSSEDFFGGMNRVYIAHHLYGGISFTLLLVHPITSAIGMNYGSWHDIAAYLLPGADWSINLGIAALSFMMTLMILAFFIKIPYEIWKFTHKFLGAIFLLATVHAFFAPGDLVIYAPLRIYMLGVLLFTTVFYIYRTVLGPFMVHKYQYMIEEVDNLRDNVTQVKLSPVSEVMPYKPGQFLFIKFRDKTTGGEWHPFSIASIPSEPDLMVTAKAEGSFTKNMAKLPVAAVADIEGAYGRFNYRKYNKEQIWIAGGIGITPFYSMAKSLPETEGDFKVCLFYSVRELNEAIYLEELETIAKTYPNFRVVPYDSATKGRLNAEIIEKDNKPLAGKEIFICGPPPMMKSMRDQFLKLGVLNSRIHSEEFAFQ